MAYEESHFEEESWLGLALRLVPADQAARMQAHLDRGCTECTKIWRLWSLVAETAAREHLYEPPRDVVQAVKALLPLVQKLPLLPRLTRPVRIMFDSFHHPLPVGIRGSTSLARDLRYETDDFLIDLRLKEEDVKRIAVCGQIVSKRPGPASSHKIGVLLTGENARLLGHTIVNSLGEFQFEVENQGPLTLYMDFPNSTITHIDLPPV